jgi:hypothetical protein
VRNLNWILTDFVTLKKKKNLIVLIECQHIYLYFIKILIENWFFYCKFFKKNPLKSQFNTPPNMIQIVNRALKKTLKIENSIIIDVRIFSTIIRNVVH